MVKNNVLIILSFCILLCGLILTPGHVSQASNVKDCLENDPDCLDISEEIQVQMDPTDEDGQINESNNQSLFLTFLKMFFALFVVLGLIYLTLRFLNKRHKLFQPIQALENLGGISLGQNKSIQVVRVGSNVYLIGVGENVELLQEIVDEDVINDLLHTAEDQTTARQWIASFMGKKQTNEDAGNRFKHMFSSELSKLKRKRQEIITQQKQKEDMYE